MICADMAARPSLAAVAGWRSPGGRARGVWEDRGMAETQGAMAQDAGTVDISGLVVGVLGGTGDQGRGLARRLALAGHKIIIGSRDPGRAAAAAQTCGGSGGRKPDCAQQA